MARTHLQSTAGAPQQGLRMEGSPHISPVRQLHCCEATKAFKGLVGLGNLDVREVTRAGGEKKSHGRENRLNEK